MHVLEAVKNNVNRSHPGLGRLFAFTLVSTRARKAVLVISPSGFGKSANSEAVGTKYPMRLQRIDSASMASLAKRDVELNGFNGLLIIDDLTKAGTPYMRIATISTIAELVYSHFVDRSAGNTRVIIRDFQGAAVMNMQPVWFRQIAQAPEWDAVIKEKVIRYYHLIRPTNPNTALPVSDHVKNTDFDKVKNHQVNAELWQQLDDIASTQWSDARIKEHVPALLRACAALDGRTSVDNVDAKTLIDLMRPMTLERYVLRATGFETEREYEPASVYLIAELATNPKAAIKDICRHYKFSKSQAYSIIQSLSRYVHLSPKRSGRLIPTKETKIVLKEAGYNV